MLYFKAYIKARYLTVLQKKKRHGQWRNSELDNFLKKKESNSNFHRDLIFCRVKYIYIFLLFDWKFYMNIFLSYLFVVKLIMGMIRQVLKPFEWIHLARRTVCIVSMFPSNKLTQNVLMWLSHMDSICYSNHIITKGL